MQVKRFEPGSPFTNEDIQKIERVVGKNLPDDYKDFAKTYGGAFVGGLVNGVEELSILRFFDAASENGIISKLQLYTDLRDAKALPIADCELGNLYVLDQNNAVYYIDYYGGSSEAKKISNSFEEFVSSITVQE